MSESSDEIQMQEKFYEDGISKSDGGLTAGFSHILEKYTTAGVERGEPMWWGPMQAMKIFSGYRGNEQLSEMITYLVIRLVASKAPASGTLYRDVVKVCDAQS